MVVTVCAGIFVVFAMLSHPCLSCMLCISQPSLQSTTVPPDETSFTPKVTRHPYSAKPKPKDKDPGRSDLLL